MRYVCEKEKTPCRDGMVSFASAAEVSVPVFLTSAFAVLDACSHDSVVLMQGLFNLCQATEGVAERHSDQCADGELDECLTKGNGVTLKGTASPHEEEHSDTEDDSRDGLQRMYDAIGLFACHKQFSFLPSIGNDFPNLPAAYRRLFRAYRPDRVMSAGTAGCF